MTEIRHYICEFIPRRSSTMPDLQFSASAWGNVTVRKLASHSSTRT